MCLHLELVQNVTPCYLIDLCSLCGRDIKRGICLPETGLSRCECFTNTDDPLRPYMGEFCYPKDESPPSTTSSSSRWTHIIVGILSGLAGLLCSITCSLLVMAIWRRRRQLSHEE